jgi:hypothetical protein
LPRLPKLASSQVLRQALADGARQGLFGLASGSAWDAEDSVLRFGEFVEPSEIQFQPGTWLVRAAAIKKLIAAHTITQPLIPDEVGAESQGSSPTALTQDEARIPQEGGNGSESRRSPQNLTLGGVTLNIRGVPGTKLRDVVKVAVLPLSAASPEVTVNLAIRAEGGMAGIPRETLNLVVLEGLRQLGLQDVSVEIDDPK